MIPIVVSGPDRSFDPDWVRRAADRLHRGVCTMSAVVSPLWNDHRHRQAEDVLRALIEADRGLEDDLAGSEPLSVLIAHALDIRRLAGRAKLLLDGG